MNLLPKEVADRLFQEGKMPEDFYRMYYKTFQENWIDSCNSSARKGREYLEKRRQEQEEKESVKMIDKFFKDAIEGAIDNLNK